MSWVDSRKFDNINYFLNSLDWELVVTSTQNHQINILLNIIEIFNKIIFLISQKYKKCIIIEEQSFDRINMTEWIWPKNVYLTEKITPTNMNVRTWPIKYDNDEHENPFSELVFYQILYFLNNLSNISLYLNRFNSTILSRCYYLVSFDLGFWLTHKKVFLTISKIPIKFWYISKRLQGLLFINWSIP